MPKNRQSLTIFILTATLLFIVARASALAPKMKIVIDAGHGGADTGAVNGPISESEIALTVAQKLKSELQSLGSFEIHMTRNNNETISLDSRTRMASRLKTDLFISLHVNSNPSPSAHGTEIYIFGQMAENEESLFLAHQENEALKNSSEINGEDPEEAVVRMTDLQIILQDIQHIHGTKESLKIAKILKSTWTKLIGSPTRINQAPFHVLANVTSPSLLIELGFLSHAQEGNWLVQPSNQDRMAKALAIGLKKYLEELDKTPSAGHITTHAN